MHDATRITGSYIATDTDPDTDIAIATFKLCVPRYSSVRKIDPVLDLSNQNTALTSAVQCSHIPQGWIDALPIQLGFASPVKSRISLDILPWRGSVTRRPGPSR